MATSHVHRNNFNLIRLFAAAQVLLVHSLNHNGFAGWPPVEALKATPGVPVFFFISGYLISTSYFRRGEAGLTGFFRNRVLRIYPALVVCVIAATLMVYLTGYLSAQRVGVAPVALWMFGQMSIVQFYNPGFMREFGVGVLNGALWTITVELQFYLLTPLLGWLLDKSKAATALLFAISMLANVYIGWIAVDRSWLEKLFSVTFVPWVFMFMLGMFASRSDLFRRAILRPPLFVLIPLYLVSMFMIGGYKGNAQNAINPVSFLILTMIIFQLAHLAIPFAKAAQAFFNRNDFSYGIYLFHMPIINLMLFLGAAASIGIPVVMVGTVTCAILSWYLIERPALRLKRRPASG